MARPWIKLAKNCLNVVPPMPRVRGIADDDVGGIIQTKFQNKRRFVFIVTITVFGFADSKLLLFFVPLKLRVIMISAFNWLGEVISEGCAGGSRERRLLLIYLDNAGFYNPSSQTNATLLT